MQGADVVEELIQLAVDESGRRGHDRRPHLTVGAEDRRTVG
jgi:hypothetical protein